LFLKFLKKDEGLYLANTGVIRVSVDGEKYGLSNDMGLVVLTMGWGGHVHHEDVSMSHDDSSA
jgi:hypothetical protein